MATYYVATTGNDTTGDGSIGSPWLTITKGQSMLSAGDTLYVRGGRYYESVTLTKNGTEGNPITIKAYPGETPILDGTEAVTGWTQCESDDAFLTVQGVVNPNYANIYWAKIHKDNLPTIRVDTTQHTIDDFKKFVLFEDSIHCRIARWPDQEFGYGYDTDLFNSVAPEAYGETEFLLDSTRLTQADDYWNGAMIDIWSHAANNFVIRRLISDSDQSEHTVTFSEALTYPISYGTDPDAYSIVNHPHVLDSAGEFAHTMTTDAEGYYTFYLWPKNVNNLTSNVRISAKTYGFYKYNANYLTIDGFKIVGYINEGIRFRVASPYTVKMEGAIVRNCIVEDCGTSGIYFSGANHSIIEYCTIRRVGDRGAFITNGAYNTIQYCDVLDTGGTNVSFYTTKYSRLIGNILRGSSGVHGNGISCYINCDKILIAYNYFPLTNLALQDICNVVVYANVFDADNLRTSIVTTWPNAYGGTHEYQIYLNNTIIGSSNASGFVLYTGVSDPIPQNYVVNNILDGCNSWDAIEIIEMDYNFYTGYGWRQSSSLGWSLGEHEIDGRDASLTSIFVDPTSSGEDYSLATDSPVIYQGKDISSILSTTGATTWFPDFDFTKDKAGNVWNDVPSIGAYEYQSDESGGSLPDSSDIYYTLTSSCSGNGSISNGVISWVSNSRNYQEGTSITLTASDTTLSIFTGWSGDIVSSETSITFNMDKDYTIVANFAEAERKSLSLNTLSNNLLIFTTKHLKRI